MQGISIRRSFPHLPPVSAFRLSPFVAYTPRRFLPAVFAPSRFPHVQLPDPYMRFQPLPIFRMYRSPVPTCAFSLFPLSACTIRRSLHALSAFSHFRMYNPPIPTCAFSLFPFSACTIRRFLPVLSVSSHFPHVLPVNPYLRFRPHPVFRTYTPPIPTCAFDLTPSSARTPRRFLHASPTTPRLSHVHPVNPYLHFRFPTAFRTYGSLIPTCASGFLPFSACTAC